MVNNSLFADIDGRCCLAIEPSFRRKKLIHLLTY